MVLSLFKKNIHYDKIIFAARAVKLLNISNACKPTRWRGKTLKKKELKNNDFGYIAKCKLYILVFLRA